MVDYISAWSYEEVLAEFSIAARELYRIDGREFLLHVQDWNVFQLTQQFILFEEPCLAAAA